MQTSFLPEAQREMVGFIRIALKSWGMSIVMNIGATSCENRVCSGEGLSQIRWTSYVPRRDLSGFVGFVAHR